MKKKFAAILAFVMVLVTCMNAMAASYSLKWAQSADGNWHIYGNGVLLKNTWVLDDECNVAGGVWYLVDENGNLVSAPLVHDGEGRYYSFNDQHDGHYGAMLTAAGNYYGTDLVFEQDHNGGFGSITNKEGIASLTAKYGVKEMPNIKNTSTVKLSEVNKVSSDSSDDGPVYYSVSFNLNHNNATPSQIQAQSVTYGSRLVKPATPSDLNREMDFTGWTRTQDGTDYWDFDTDTVTKNFTLFAKWAIAGTKVTGIALSDLTVNLYPEGTKQLTATVYPADAVVKTLNWTSSDEAVATVSSTGLITAKAAGTATVTAAATDGSGVAASCTVTVTARPAASLLTFTAEQAGSSITFKYKSGTAQYSLDGGTTWKDCKAAEDATGTEIALTSKGDTVCFKGTNVTTDQFNHFSMTGKIAASGDVTSLTNGKGGDTALSDACYMAMFYQCEDLAKAPELPSTTLANNCYSYMFGECASLTAAPALPATSLKDYCYCGTFYGCTALTAAPELPATVLAEDCYYEMFFGCTALTAAPALKATTLAKSCYSEMFYGCTSLTQAPELPALTLKERCYDNMFSCCSSLTKAQDTLPATTLADYCYSEMYSESGLTAAPSIAAENLASHCCYQMFKACSKLTAAPALPAQTLAESCYSHMFSGCTSLTTVQVLPATTLANNCYDGMFDGCTGLVHVPGNMLPAETMYPYCYYQMFTGCTKLASVPALPATNLAHACYSCMFAECTSLNQVPALPASTLQESCYSSMFSGCSSLKLFHVSEAGHEHEWKIPTGGAGTTAYNAFYSTFKDVYGGTKIGSIGVTFYLESAPVTVTE